ncbi:MAG: hypothetical protein ACE5JA_09885, partial [bacterium]
MRTFILFLLLVAFLGLPTRAEWNRTSGYIDIPTARILGANHVRGSATWHFALGIDSFPADADFSLSYGIANRAEVSAYMLTARDLAASIAFKVVDESQYVPALALGVQDISANRWVSSVGRGEGVGFSDDVDYWTVSSRNPERFSAYVVATKTFGRIGEYTLGIGR